MRLDELNLFELTGVKHMYEKDLDDILKSLEEKGALVLGRGSFALALKNSSKDEVIKFWIKDHSYDDFVDHVVKNPSPWFPKLYSKPKELSAFFLRPADFPEKIKYVRMEKLTHIPSNIDENHIENMLKSPMYGQGHMDEYVEDWLEVLQREDEEEQLKARATAIKLFGKTKAELEKFWKFADGLYIDLIRNKGNSYDIHSENIMMRGNELVFTDPVYNRSEHNESSLIRSGLQFIRRYKNDPDEMKNIPHKSGRSNSKEKSNA